MAKDYLKELRAERKTELAELKVRWEALKLQVEAEKEKHPKLANKLDAYLDMLKNTIRDIIMDDEDFDEEDLADYRYIFGEDYDAD